PEVRRHVERFANLLEEYYLEDPALFREIDGAGEILEKLQNHPEWKVGIATGAWKESALFKLQAAGLDVENIPMVTCSDAKTREEILRKCIEDSKERYGVAEFEKTVSVGDALWDIKTANRLKVGFIGINQPGKFDGFPNCKVLRDFSKGETFMRYLEEAEVPELP
ncbi:MAG: HAD family hydrolase, partial [Candidatus Abyssubacteria bacterium]|nr:HAD family hydrolase [Candidatus Abyssubacteria bacterium]